MIAMNRLFISILALLSLLTFTCAHLPYERLYQVSARPWLFELGQRLNIAHMDISQVPDSELDLIRDRGFTLVYLLGVWKLGDVGLNIDKANLNNYRSTLPDVTDADIIGSMFAVVDYTVNPEIGTTAQLRQFRQRLASRGIKLMLDFVPNHSAIDAVQMKSHPEYYITKPPGWQANPDRYINGTGAAFGRDLYSGAWIDTAQYNFWSPATRAARIADLVAAGDLCDGLRVDMAMLALDDVVERVWGNELRALGYSQPATPFWTEVISKLRQVHPHIIMMAELYWNRGQDLINQGFDFVYDKDMLDAMVSQDSYAPLNYLRNVDQGFLTKTAHFVSNHDEHTLLSQINNDVTRAKAYLAAVQVTPGIHFTWMGDWEGYTSRLDVHLRRRYNPIVNKELFTWATTKLQPAITHPIFKDGDASWAVPVAGDPDQRMACYLWTADRAESGPRRVLACVNMSAGTATSRLHLPGAQGHQDGAGNVVVTDLISGDKYSRSAREVENDGIWVILSGYQVQILSYA